MDANKRISVKMLAALAGGGVVVAMGALAMAIVQEQAVPGTVASSGITMGVTSTQETPPTAPATSIAVPTVKAKPFGGAGS